MTKSLIFGLAALVCFIGAHGQVQANLIYTNLGTGGAFDSGRGNAFGSFGFGLEFTVPAGSNYIFTDAIAPLQMIQDTNEVLMFLETDAAGLPGTILESIDILGAMGTSSPNLVTGNSALNPLLVAGTSYWLVMTAADSFTGISWNANSTGDISSPSNGFVADYLAPGPNGPWQTYNTGIARSAFEIDGNPVTTTATPTPSTLVMSSILFGMFGVVWSYKRLKETAIAA